MIDNEKGAISVSAIWSCNTPTDTHKLLKTDMSHHEWTYDKKGTVLQKSYVMDGSSGITWRQSSC